MNEQVPSDTLTRLRQYAKTNHREPWIPVKATELMALVECAEVLHTDYLLISLDQQLKALEALKELGL